MVTTESRIGDEDPAEREIVAVQHAIKAAFRKTIEESVLLLVIMLQETRTHHGRGRQRDEQRDADGRAEDHGEFAEQPPTNATHHEDGDKDGHERRHSWRER